VKGTTVGLRHVIRGGFIAAALLVAGGASAQTTAVAARSAAELSALAPVPTESRLSLAGLQVTPIGSWRISNADTENQRIDILGPRPFAPPVRPQPWGNKKRAGAYRGVQRALAGVAMGFAGFLAGGIVGARIEGSGCACDSPGLYGFIIGAPIGAAAGAIAGVMMVR
jgi:hypothetical protein